MARQKTLTYHYMQSKEMKTKIAFVSRVSELGIAQFGYAYTEESINDLPALRIVNQQLRKIIDMPKKSHFEIISVTDLTFNNKNNKFLSTHVL